MTTVAGERVSLRRAALTDRSRAYEWLVQSDLSPNLFGPLFPEREVPTHAQFAARYVNSHFDGTRPYAGRMFVITAAGVEVGFIAHGRIDLLNDVVEVDVWLASAAHAGRGVGSRALVLLTDWLQASYGVNRFLARPSRRNVHALRALRRAGFRETDLPAADVVTKLRLGEGTYADEVLLFRTPPPAPHRLRREDGRTYVFVDSEFTRLVDPQLISLGAVATDATAFYAEVDGWSRDRTSEFVRRIVIPLLDGDSVPPAVAAEAFAAWLDERAGRAPTTIVSDSGFDRWAIAELLGSEDLPSGIEWRRIAVAYDELDHATHELGLRRHHALDDARALRHLLVNAASGAAGPRSG